MLEFFKYEAAGNDFILILWEGDGEWGELARELCRRHFGVGADGLILVRPLGGDRLEMRLFNADGSEAEVCGNGLRCIAAFALERGLASGDRLEVVTGSGVREVIAYREGSRVTRARVNMGAPRFHPRDIPLAGEFGGGPLLDFPLEVMGRELRLGFVSMGNPHAVLFLEASPDEFPLEHIGPAVEHHPLFPNRTNFEVARNLPSGEFEVRVWERGVGETLACGSGACAVAAVARAAGRAGEKVDIRLKGGVLRVLAAGEELWLEGPVAAVFYGRWLKEGA